MTDYKTNEKEIKRLLEEANKPEKRLYVKIFVSFLILDAAIVFLILLIALVRWFI